MQMIRKRSFSDYQRNQELEQSSPKQVLTLSNLKSILKSNLPSQKIDWFLTSRFVKSKKNKILKRFDENQEKTAIFQTEKRNVSAIQLLKKELIALESDQVLSFRGQIDSHWQDCREKCSSVQSEPKISAIFTKFNQIKKFTPAQNLKNHFSLYYSKLHTQTKDQRLSLKKIFLSTHKEPFEINRIKINFQFQKQNKKVDSNDCNQRKKFTSCFNLTAKKFYDYKNKKRVMTENGQQIYQRNTSIKKIKIQKRVASNSHSNS